MLYGKDHDPMGWLALSLLAVPIYVVVRKLRPDFHFEDARDWAWLGLVAAIPILLILHFAGVTDDWN